MYWVVELPAGEKTEIQGYRHSQTHTTSWTGVPRLLVGSGAGPSSGAQVGVLWLYLKSMPFLMSNADPAPRCTCCMFAFILHPPAHYLTASLLFRLA